MQAFLRDKRTRGLSIQRVVTSHLSQMRQEARKWVNDIPMHGKRGRAYAKLAMNFEVLKLDRQNCMKWNLQICQNLNGRRKLKTPGRQHFYITCNGQQPLIPKVTAGIMI